MAAQEFAHVVRTLAATAREAGFVAPSFRSPPGVPGVARTMRRRADGSVQVAVSMAERPWAAVQADVVEGFVVTNALTGPAAERLRALLWDALHPGGPSRTSRAARPATGPTDAAA